MGDADAAKALTALHAMQDWGDGSEVVWSGNDMAAVVTDMAFWLFDASHCRSELGTPAPFQVSTIREVTGSRREHIVLVTAVKRTCRWEEERRWRL